MTMRERMLAVVRGREHDRVPFVQYDNSAAPNETIWGEIGRDRMGILRWTTCYWLESPNCHFEREVIHRGGKEGLRRTLHTPEGNLTEISFPQPTYGVSVPCEHFVNKLDDYRILAAYFRDVVVRTDTTPIETALRELGDDGLPHVFLPRTPYQQLWIQWVNIQDLGVHMLEFPAEMEELIALMTDVQRRIFEVAVKTARELPIPYLDFGDNITAPMLGVPFFERYCVSAYDELAGMLEDAGVDIPVFVHMDGDLKPLWDAIGASRVRGLDSLSPPPDNDTSVAEARSRWPEMRLCVNFPSSVHLASPERIYETTMQLLEQGGRAGRLQIQISENTPPERWRTSYPEIVRAIDDFGAAC